MVELTCKSVAPRAWEVIQRGIEDRLHLAAADGHLPGAGSGQAEGDLAVGVDFRGDEGLPFCRLASSVRCSRNTYQDDSTHGCHK